MRYTRESLQATVEELETSNEELQASNEELVASNEELQSTNEELHSVNEELYTVNAEHQRKIQELMVLTDDMDNLLASTQVHTVFLDRELRIRKFTPSAAEIFGLLPHDTGRSFDSFSYKLRRESLNQDLLDVLRTGRSVEADAQDQRGNWFLLRILPYQTKQALDGVLLTLVDIGPLKQVQQELARREFELRMIADHIPVLISYVDRELNYRFVNRRYCEFFAKSEREIVGHPMAELLGEPTFEQLLPMIRRVLAGEAVEFEHRFVPRSGQSFWAIVSYIPDREEHGQEVRGFFVCKNVVTALKEVEQRFDRAVRGTTDGIWDWNIDTGKVYYSPKFAELLTPGKHKLEVMMKDGSRMPYSMAINYHSVKPNSSDNCKLHLEVSLRDKRVDEGAATEATVVVVNRTNEAIPTPIAIIGIPGGLEVRHDQLKELVKQGKISAYEVIGREVVLYWRSLDKEARVELPLSLIAAVPGTYTGPASRAYLYYTDELKQWTDGLNVEIQPKGQ